MMPFAHSATPRIAPVVDPEPDVADVLSRTLDHDGVPLAIFRTLAHHPRLLKRFNVLAGLFMTRGELPARRRELAVLRTAWRTRSVYEWGQHVVIGRRVGLTDNEIVRITRPIDGEAWPAAEAALLRFTDQLLDHADVDDQIWETVRTHLTEPQSIELVMLVGFYRMAAGFLNTTGVQVEHELPGWPLGAVETKEDDIT